MRTKQDIGRVITVRGPVAPEKLGAVMMHEHLHGDFVDSVTNSVIQEEKPITADRRELLMRKAIPFLQQCCEFGCGTFVDTTMPPWRAWPAFYPEASRATRLHVVLCTGFYREIELGTYWAQRPEDQIWPFVRKSSVEELSDFCVQEIVEGIHGTDVHAGAIKLGTSQPVMTEAEQKAFRAGARAQKATGVHITTHCTKIGAETSQLKLLDQEGVDLRRVVIGHTAGHLMDAECRKVCLEWMKRGANFLPTNLGIGANGGETWRPLVEAVHEIFAAGLGEHIAGFSLDAAFCSFVTKDGPFGYVAYIPPPPFLHLFTNTLPAFRKMGLTPDEEDMIMRRNPQRILPVQ